MKLQNPISFLKSKKAALSGRSRASFGLRYLILVSAACLVVGVALGAAFGDRILHRGVPVRVSKVPEINDLLRKVSRHIAIDPSEDPTVATVQQADLLRQQNPAFYRDVQNGDRLIVWSDRAVLYSPSRDLVLSAMVVPTTAEGSASGTPAAAVAPAPGPSVKELNYEIRNGTGKVGATKALVDKLKQNGYPTATVANAAKTYLTTTIVKLTDKAKSASDADVLPALVGGSFGELPAGEKASKADILIILGTDQG